MPTLTPIRKPGEEHHIIFKDIAPDTVSEGLCFVCDGEVRTTRFKKPYIRLSIQDITGAVIPAYIFDTFDFDSSGLDLTKVIRSVVKISYEENYLPKYGMSVRVTKLEQVVNPSTDLLSKYVGSSDKAMEAYELLLSRISDKLNLKLSLPSDICHITHPDFYNGKVGGLAMHYKVMSDTLESYEHMFDEDERNALWGTFLLYIFAHSNFIKADADGNADITLVGQLTNRIAKFKETLPVGEGSLELVHIFFGYKPKDIYVRVVVNVSNNIIRASKEINLFHALPITREGDAGYGPVKRYQKGGEC